MNDAPQPSLALESLAPAWLAAIVLALVAAAVYWPAGQLELVSLDDWVYVTNNSTVRRGLSLDGLRYAFTEPVCANWHPLTVLSHMLDCSLWGVRPAAHHAVNVALHAINAGLLLVVLAAMTRRLWGAAIVAAVFALHPLRVESVAWVAERKDVLAGLFWILTLAAYTHYARRPSLWRYLLVVLGLVLGLLSKPMVVTLPFVLLLLDVWPLRRAGWPAWRSPDTLRARRRLIGEKLPLFLLVATSSIVTFVVQRDQGAVEALEAFPPLVRVAGAVQGYVGYLAKTFWPVGLAVHYPASRTIDWPPVIGGLTLLVGVTVLVWWLRNRAPWTTVGWLWFLGTLVPVIGLVQVGTQAMADRYTYLPSIGLSIAIVYSLDALLAQRTAWRAAATGVIAGLLVSCAVLTYRQLDVWRNSETLFRHAIAVTGDNAVAELGLANLYGSRGNYRAALPHYERAVALDNHQSLAHFNLAVALLERRERLDEALAHFEHARQLGYADAVIDTFVAAALTAAGRDDEARPLAERAKQAQNPAAPKTVEVWGVLATRAGQADQAAAAYREVLDRAFEPFVAGRLAWLRATHPNAALRNVQEALELAATACSKTEHRAPELLRVLAAAQATSRQHEAALETATQALRRTRDLIAEQESPRWQILAKALEADMEEYGRGRPLRQAPAETAY